MSYEIINSKLAISIAEKAHKGQVDKGGRPYIEHPIKIASEFYDDKYKASALLHDVIEDSDLTLDYLRGCGLHEDVVNAVDALTKRKGELYQNYLVRVKENAIAKAVKLVDLQHNSDTSRIEHPTEKDYLRAKKYRDAIIYLNK